MPAGHRSQLLRTSSMVLILGTMIACGGGSGGDPVSNPITVSVSPATATVNSGASRSFTATLTNATDNRVTWSASGGTIQGSGGTATWTAPVGGGPYTVTATSVQDPSKSGSATVTVTPVSISIAPQEVTVSGGGTQNFTATVSGSANTGVSWSASGGTIDGTGTTITWTAPTGAGSYTITATSSADPTKKADATASVTALTIAVDPPAPTVGAGGTQQFTATVSGGASTGVTWSASGGTITGSGASITWTAPPVGGTYTITATSIANPTISGSATVTVTPIDIAIAPTAVSLYRGESTTFTATVTGAGEGTDDVTWTSTCGVGTPDDLSLSYVAPQTGGPCTVTATSAADPTRTASATVSLRAEWLVSATDDVNDGTCNFVHCSLREALTSANVSADADVIMLGSAAASATVRDGSSSGAQNRRSASMSHAAITGTVTLTSALPTLTTPISIVGPGAAQLTIDAAASVANQRRVFTISGDVVVSISGLTLRGGRHAVGGAILIDDGADVALSDATIANNQALEGDGGGINVFGGSTLALDDVLLEDNRTLSSSGKGGAIVAAGQSSVIARNSIIRNNVSTGSRGGGVYGTGAFVTLEQVTLSGNSSHASGGGVSVWDGGSLIITGGVVTGNVSGSVGGGVIVGASLETSDPTRVTLTMTDAVVEHNESLYQGGGIQMTRNVSATLTRSKVRNNEVAGTNPGSPTIGGGIFIGRNVTATLDQSTISGNSIAQTTGDEDDGGGGIAVNASGVDASLTLTNSTVSGNNAPARGGGLLVFGGGVVTVVNSTISGNSAPSGAGIRAEGTVTLRNATIIGNTATAGPAGVFPANGSVMTLTSTLLSANMSGSIPVNCSGGAGTINSGGNNLSSDATCSTLNQATDKQNTSAGVNATLADNGGPTLTHALLAGSAAINAGNAATCPATDQRGVARVGICDIGAFEFVQVDASTQSVFGRWLGLRVQRSPARLGRPAKAPLVALPVTGSEAGR